MVCCYNYNYKKPPKKLKRSEKSRFRKQREALEKLEEKSKRIK